MRSQLVRTVAVALVVVACASACSRSPQLDGRQLERTLVSTAQQLGMTDVSSSHCPTRPSRASQIFECTTTQQDLQVRWSLKQTDTVGTLQVSPKETVVELEKVRADVAVQSASVLGAPATAVDCGPDRLKVVPIGGAMRCSATVGGAVRPLDVRIVDVSGAVQVKVATSTPG